jgi:uncharacterized OB-fold protein
MEKPIKLKICKRCGTKYYRKYAKTPVCADCAAARLKAASKAWRAIYRRRNHKRILEIAVKRMREKRKDADFRETERVAVFSRMRGLRDSRIAAGVCSECGSAPHRPGLKTCEVCYTKISKRNRAKQRAEIKISIRRRAKRKPP